MPNHRGPFSPSHFISSKENSSLQKNPILFAKYYFLMTFFSHLPQNLFSFPPPKIFLSPLSLLSFTLTKICGAFVSARGEHGLSCSLGFGRVARHGVINDLIHRSLIKAGFPAVKEPQGLLRSDGKRPD